MSEFMRKLQAAVTAADLAGGPIDLHNFELMAIHVLSAQEFERLRREFARARDFSTKGDINQQAELVLGLMNYTAAALDAADGVPDQFPVPEPIVQESKFPFEDDLRSLQQAQAALQRAIDRRVQHKAEYAEPLVECAELSQTRKDLERAVGLIEDETPVDAVN